MKLAEMTVNVNKNGTAQKEIEGCLVLFGFNVQNGTLNNINARIHEKGEKDQVGTYMGEVNMNPATGKVNFSFTGENDDTDLQFALVIAIKPELVELRNELKA